MVKVNFVCMGNICRSPAAEGVFTQLVDRAGLSDSFIIDSSGTIGYHAGEKADPRMREEGKRRGIELTSISRKFISSDFEFDYIVTMDNDNYENILRLASSKEQEDKVVSMTSFCSKIDAHFVPDPYYGGAEGFSQVFDILEDACQGLLDHIKAKHF